MALLHLFLWQCDVQSPACYIHFMNPWLPMSPLPYSSSSASYNETCFVRTAFLAQAPARDRNPRCRNRFIGCFTDSIAPLIAKAFCHIYLAKLAAVQVLSHAPGTGLLLCSLRPAGSAYIYLRPQPASFLQKIIAAGFSTEACLPAAGPILRQVHASGSCYNGDCINILILVQFRRSYRSLFGSLYR